MGQDLAHKRPWLLASLIAGLSYPATWLILPIDGGLYAIVWKMAAVGLLIPYALRRHHSGEFAVLASVMALYATGDGLIELDLRAGAIAFAFGHMVAMGLYWQHRRVGAVFSQKLLAWTLFILTPLLAFSLPDDMRLGLDTAIYGLVLGGMAAMAWSSNFPRYRVGIGAVLFVISDLLIFARLGPLDDSEAAKLAIWYLYYFGVFLIATGIAQTLVKRGHYAKGEQAE